MHQNSSTPPVVEAKGTRYKREIESGSRGETDAQYQLLKADASGGRVTGREWEGREYGNGKALQLEYLFEVREGE